jgi:hypothetical protein
MGFRVGLPTSKKTAPLVVVLGTGVALSVLMGRSGDATGPSARTAQVVGVDTAWTRVAAALDAYQTYSRSSAQDRPAGDAGLAVVRTAAERSRTYLDAVEKARLAWDVTADEAGLPSKAGDGLPSASTADEAGGAVAAWVDAQRTQGLLVSTCLGSTRTLAAAQSCFRARVDGETQQSWLAAATRVGKARAALEKELAG